jgi:RNA polymerase sigma-70 factor (ECF subfamily)
LLFSAAMLLARTACDLDELARIRRFAGEDDQALALRAIFGDDAAQLELTRRNGHELVTLGVDMGVKSVVEDDGEDEDEREGEEESEDDTPAATAPPPRDPAAEGRLIARAQAGDSSAFEELVAPYLVRLHRSAYRHLRHSEDAEDAVQTALVEAWRNIGALRQRRAITGWLATITRRTAIDMRDRRHVAQAGADDIEHLCDPRILDLGDLVALRAGLDGALAALVEPYRAVARLRLAEGYSEEETAELLGVPVNTVKSRLNRARAKLRVELLATGRQPATVPTAR